MTQAAESRKIQAQRKQPKRTTRYKYNKGNCSYKTHPANLSLNKFWLPLCLHRRRRCVWIRVAPLFIDPAQDKHSFCPSYIYMFTLAELNFTTRSQRECQSHCALKIHVYIVFYVVRESCTPYTARAERKCGSLVGECTAPWRRRRSVARSLKSIACMLPGLVMTPASAGLSTQPHAAGLSSLGKF
jgi:hypothetical protein